MPQRIPIERRIVSSALEADVWVSLQGFLPFQREIDGASLAIHAVDPAEAAPRVFSFELTEGARLLSDADWCAMADRLIGSCPASPAGLLREIAETCLTELYRARACLLAAQSDLSTVDRRIGGYEAMLPILPPCRRNLPLPAHRWRLNDYDLMKRTLNGEIGDWRPVAFVGDKHLFMHPDGGMLWGSQRAGKLVNVRWVKGYEALKAWVDHGFHLRWQEKAAVARALRAGDSPATLLDGAVLLSEVPHHTEILELWHLISSRDTYRECVLLRVLSPDGVMLGFRFIEHDPGYEMMCVMSEIATHVDQDATAELDTALIEAASPIIEHLLHDPRLCTQVRPHPGDVERVFVGPVPEIRRRYDDWWRRPAPMRPPPVGASLQIFSAQSDAFANHNLHSARFARGWLTVAHLFESNRIWLCWQWKTVDGYTSPAGDGLVWVGDHWAWFPEPWRILEDL